VSKEERRRRREEERDEDLRQAVADIDWLRTNNTPCEWYEAQDFGDGRIREHIKFTVDDTRTNHGANAYVGERHLRIERSDRMARLAALDKTENGRDVLREAFTMADMKGAAYDV
jgi:hypothetical protein